MQWTHPDTVGDIPPPCRAHTATLYDRKLLIYGGGLDLTYYDAVYVLDTTTRRWTRPNPVILRPLDEPIPLSTTKEKSGYLVEAMVLLHWMMFGRWM